MAYTYFTNTSYPGITPVHVFGNRSLHLVSPQELKAWFALTTAFGIVGAVLTLLLFMIMVILNKFRTGSGIMISHSQLIDFIICSILNPVQNVTILQIQSGRYTLIDCRFVQFTQILFVFVGNWSAVLLAGNRFVAIVLPLHYGKVTTRWALALGITTAWIISLACSVPMYFNVGVVLGMQPTGACGTVQISGHFFQSVGIVSTYFPIALLGAMYMTVFLQQKLCKREAKRQREAMRKRVALAKALCCSFLWYCLCMLPAPVLINFFPDVWRHEFRLLMWTRTLLIIGYAANPRLLYT
ncbi:allatostatin-A receptor-like [Paramacrobiotus metropolitanus]|uniref:allatostatin-A receptor-like n=1 Tax=Paramacrobiotus metropolitanus TaxID=2943436 RepID=UPI00244632F1|nr:allatostatin-A receptor-like [Paramacrobiotus metropolitanus]